MRVLIYESPKNNNKQKIVIIEHLKITSQTKIQVKLHKIHRYYLLNERFCVDTNFKQKSSNLHHLYP